MANILIIDDDPVYAGMLQQRLNRAGHQVQLHVGPFGGTVAARKPGIDLVILDVFMPGLDGPALLELLRRDGQDRRKFIFCSSMDPAPLRALAAQHLADGYLPKSSERRQALDYIEGVLRAPQRAGAL